MAENEKLQEKITRLEELFNRGSQSEDEYFFIITLFNRLNTINILGFLLRFNSAKLG